MDARRLWKPPYWQWYGRALAVASAALAALVQARANDFPSASFWIANDSLRVALAGGAVVNAFLVAVQLWRLTDLLLKARRTQRVRKAAAFLLEQVCNASKMELWPTKLAVHVWTVPLKRGRADVSKPLRRVCTYTITAHRRSGVDWHIGKGVVGKAWRDEEDFIADLEPLVGAQRRGEAAFGRRTEDSRLGMTFGEVRKTKRYSAIFARPLYNMDGNLIGIVSIDSTQRHAVQALRLSVEAELVRAAIEGVETTLAQLHSPTDEPAE